MTGTKPYAMAPVYLLLGLAGSLLQAQILPFKTYTPRDGLPSSRVSSFFQDSRGELWISTDNGIAVYDGVKFRTYGVRDGLPFRFVIQVLESRYQPEKFYIATHGAGLSIMEQGEFRNTIRFGDGFAANIVQQVCEDHLGQLWCRTAVGTFRVTADSVTMVFPGQGREGGPYTFLAGDSTVWMSLPGQVRRYNPATAKMDTLELLNSKAHISCHSIDDEHSMWVGTNKGVLYRIENERIVSSMEINPEFFLLDMIDDRAGYLWVNTWEGIFKIETEGFPHGERIHYTEENGLPGNEISGGFLDNEGNLWLSSLWSGAIKLSHRNLYSYDLKPIRREIMPKPAYLQENGHIFVGAGDGIWEIWKNRDGSWQRFLHDISAIHSPGHYYSLVMDNKARLWIAIEESGIFGYQITPGKDGPSELNIAHRLAGNSAYFLQQGGTLYFSPDDQLWLSAAGTLRQGAHLEGGSVTQIDVSAKPFIRKRHTAEDGLPGSAITSIVRDQEGNLYLGAHSGGVAEFRPAGGEYKLSRKIDKSTGLGSNDISVVLPHSNGDLWMGTRFNGIEIHKTDGSASRLNTLNGLLNDVVKALAEDEAGNVWIATSAGVQIATPGEGKMLQPLQNLKGRYFGQIWLVPGERIFTGLDWNSLTIYEYGRDWTISPPVPVSITRVRVNGRPVSIAGGSAEVSYGQSMYEIDFLGVSLKDESALRYDYSLTSENMIDWSGSTSQRSVQYTSLQPGEYRFEVFAVKSNGVRSEQPAQLRFSVLPPLWQRGWFLLLAASMIGGFLYYLHRLRLQKALAIEQIRSRIATDLHDEIGAGLTHIGLLSAVALRQNAALSTHPPGSRPTEENIPQALSESMVAVGNIARELSSAMSDVVWSINPKHDSIAALYRRLKAFATTVCEAKNIVLKMSVSEHLFKLKLHPEVRRNLLLIAKEAVHNAAKYSNSASVEVRIEHSGDALSVSVMDWGTGFNPDREIEGNGLHNMRNRAAKLGGKCRISTQSGKGTEVAATIPLRK